MEYPVLTPPILIVKVDPVIVKLTPLILITPGAVLGAVEVMFT